MGELSRRSFLRTTLTATGSACCAAALGKIGDSIAWAQSPAFNGKTIVVLHLDGGCDSRASWDIPTDSSNARAAYQQVRPASQIASANILPTAGGWGLHPAYGRGPRGGVHRLFLDGKVRLMRRVGFFDGNRSHDAMQREFETLGNQSGGTGWMGRVLDATASASRFMCVALAEGNPIDIQGATRNGLGLSSLGSYSLPNITDTNDRTHREYIHRQILNSEGTVNQLIAARVDGQKAMYDAIGSIQSANAAFTGRGTSNNRDADAYSDVRPGPQLRNIAAMIWAGLPMQLAVCSIGGFDLHSQIGNEAGEQANLCARINQSVDAFFADMRTIGKESDVLLLVDTEFDRTIQENGSQGTDHGGSITLVAVGGAVRGGVTGTAVTSDEFLRLNNRPNWLRVDYDARGAYKEALEWAGLSTNGVFGNYNHFDFDIV